MQYFLLMYLGYKTKYSPDRRRQPRRQRQVGPRGRGGSRRRSCPEVVVRWIAASGTTSADSSTATGTRSSRRAGGALVADASRHDRALRTRARRGSVRRLFHVPTYLFFHLREEGAACVNARPYAPQIYKYGHDSARRISNNRAGKIPSMTESPGETQGASTVSSVESVSR